MAGREQRLRALFARLREADQETLLAFAEFLAAREQPLAAPKQLPKLIPRPAQETVIAAIRRLSASYPMLDKAKALNEASGLMAQHILHGRSAPEVIDALEALFRACYARFEEQERGSGGEEEG
jgi:hypothetical protein